MKSLVEVANREVASVMTQTESEHVVLYLTCLEEGRGERIHFGGNWLGETHDSVCLLREKELSLTNLLAIAYTL